jgi:hypothetical protein
VWLTIVFEPIEKDILQFPKLTVLQPHGSSTDIYQGETGQKGLIRQDNDYLGHPPYSKSHVALDLKTAHSQTSPLGIIKTELLKVRAQNENGDPEN